MSAGVCMGCAAAALLAGCSVCAAAPAEGPDMAKLAQAALVSMGDTARLQHVLAKAQRGEKVTVGVIGGSITQGASATAEERRYGNRIAQWLRETCPKATVAFVNAGIGATGSNYGTLRARRDLLAARPDLVVVEYGVNDGNGQEFAETLEGLVRQILRQPNQPAIILLFMMSQGGNNAQEWQTKVGKHYNLPMASFRDGLWPEMQAGRLKWDDYMADFVHPNDRGHEAAALFVTSLAERVRKELPAGALPAIAPVPAPLLTDRFERVALYEADALKPLRNEGWTLVDGPGGKTWQADKPGSAIEFEVAGETLFVMHFRIKGSMGRAKLQVDDRPATTLEGWFDQTWGGYRVAELAGKGLPAGKHRVRLEVLPDKHAESTSTTFGLLGLGAAGLEPAK